MEPPTESLIGELQQQVSLLQALRQRGESMQLGEQPLRAPAGHPFLPSPYAAPTAACKEASSGSRGRSSETSRLPSLDQQIASLSSQLLLQTCPPKPPCAVTGGHPSAMPSLVWTPSKSCWTETGAAAPERPVAEAPSTADEVEGPSPRHQPKELSSQEKEGAVLSEIVKSATASRAAGQGRGDSQSSAQAKERTAASAGAKTAGEHTKLPALLLLKLLPVEKRPIIEWNRLDKIPRVARQLYLDQRIESHLRKQLPDLWHSLKAEEQASGKKPKRPLSAQAHKKETRLLSVLALLPQAVQKAKSEEQALYNQCRSGSVYKNLATQKLKEYQRLEESPCAEDARDTADVSNALEGPETEGLPPMDLQTKRSTSSTSQRQDGDGMSGTEHGSDKERSEEKDTGRLQMDGESEGQAVLAQTEQAEEPEGPHPQRKTRAKLVEFDAFDCSVEAVGPSKLDERLDRLRHVIQRGIPDEPEDIAGETFRPRKKAKQARNEIDRGMLRDGQASPAGASRVRDGVRKFLKSAVKPYVRSSLVSEAEAEDIVERAGRKIIQKHRLENDCGFLVTHGDKVHKLVTLLVKQTVKSRGAVQTA